MFTHKKIGIWGLGVVGKSLVRYLRAFTPHITVLDTKKPSEQDLAWLTAQQVQFVDMQALPKFLEDNEIIIPSPGIDLRPSARYISKMVMEVDIFYSTWKNKYPNAPIIAITGTVGKTSITHLLTEFLRLAGKRVAVGGNIGTAMLDLLGEPEYDYVVLELSSFQLEHSKQFTPDLAIWTNCYPNHLDRHGTPEKYFDAKYQLLARQTGDQKALVPLELAEALRSRQQSSFSSSGCSASEYSAGACSFFALHAPKITSSQRVFTLNDLEAQGVPEFSYPINWVILNAACNLLTIPFPTRVQIATLTLPDHRLDCIATHKNIKFYNDSKSTIPEATVAAVEQLQSAPVGTTCVVPTQVDPTQVDPTQVVPTHVVLLLGGVSKGVDRAPLCLRLRNKVAHVFCFGGEAEQLLRFCQKADVPASAHATLEDAFMQSVQYAQTLHSTQPVAVLLSPAGASFDLFKDYKERGERFKALVREYQES